VSRVFRELERVEDRVLGALRFVDATTGVPVAEPLLLEGDGVDVLRNRSGLYVIRGWDRLAAHSAAFQFPPAAPPVGSLQLDLVAHDRSGRYHSRRLSVRLPRDPRPDRAAEAQSLFVPVDVTMFPSPLAPVGANWVVLRASVRAAAGGDALGGALLRVLSDGVVLARGLTDWRGEALVPVPGVPVTTWSTDPDAVVVTEIPATVEAFFDPAAGTRTPAAVIRGGAAPAALPTVNPEAIEAARAGLPQSSAAVQLAAGRALSVAMEITLP
jgi:hypothetical protein